MISGLIRYGSVIYRDIKVYIELKQIKENQHSKDSIIVLVIYLTKGGFKLNSHTIYYDDIVDESNSNDNEYQIRIKSKDDRIVFCFNANDIDDYHSWVAAFQQAFILLNEKVSRYSKPRLYIKIIEAKNLESKDFNGLSDPFCQITVGNTTKKSKTIPTTLNPKFNEHFVFDCDPNVRHVEVMIFDEDLTSSPDFMGVVMIPIYDLFDGDNIEDWFELGKRTSKSSLVSGKIKIEISIFGYAGINSNLQRLFRHIQKGIGQQLEMSYDNDQSVSKYPIYFPPLEIERLEDFCGNVAISCRYFQNKVINRGALILTNCRLIFISNSRANKSNIGDLSTVIYLPQIVKLKKSGNSDDNCFEIITSDGRTMALVFDNDKNDGSNRRRSAYNLTKEASELDSDEKVISIIHSIDDNDLEYVWEQAADCPDFKGIGSFNRFFSRLDTQIINRHNLRRKALTLMSPIMTKTTSICEDSISIIESSHPFCSSTDVINALASNKFTYQESFKHCHTLQSLETYLRDISTPLEKMNFMTTFTKGWEVYDIYREFARMQIPDKDWQISICNATFDVCDTYPSIVVVPKLIDDITLKTAASFRSKKRFPTLCWRSNENLCTISRCSQPLVGINSNRSSNDEYLIELMIKHSGEVNSKSGKYVIIDCRPKINAQANQAAGKGYENEAFYKGVTVDFLGIPNIHAVRQSLEMLHTACSEEHSWFKSLDESGWLSTINKILKGALKVVQYIDQKQISVLVHCSDGWDRTSQITSLSQLLLDAHYRTLEGFITLIEKEWCSFGHKFADRLAYTYLGFKDEEMSCIFLQFLDCVYQILHQLPNAFEFNETLLLFISEHLQSGLFGNFLCNSQKERDELGVKKNCISLWTVVLCNRSQYINHSFKQQDRPIVPIVCKQRLVFWHNNFFKWNTKLCEANWIIESLDTNVNINNAGNDATLPDHSTSFYELPRELWVEDNKAATCGNCNKQFGFHGLFLIRKHHCRGMCELFSTLSLPLSLSLSLVCGFIFCGNCSDFADVSTSKKIRVCVVCMNRGNKDGSNDDNDDDKKKDEKQMKQVGRLKIDVQSGKVFLKNNTSNRTSPTKSNDASTKKSSPSVDVFRDW